MQDKSDQIKALLLAVDGTPTVKLIALLEAAGITGTAEIAELVGISKRAVRKAKSGPSAPTPKAELQDRGAELQFPPGGTTGPRGGTTVPPKRNHSSPQAELQDRGAELQFPPKIPPHPPKKKLTTLVPSGEGSVKTPLPPKGGRSDLDIVDAFNAYNSVALRCGLPQASHLTPDRRRKIGARLKTHGAQGWRQAMAHLEASEFLRGANDRGWRASLDFVLQPSSFAKLHDGAYANRAPAKAPVSALAILDQMFPTTGAVQ